MKAINTMHMNLKIRLGVSLALCGLAVGIAPRLYATPHAKPQAEAASAMVTFALSAKPPKGAVVLISGKPNEMTTNWYKRRSADPAPWMEDAQGVTTPTKTDITSKQEFGDSYVHAEFRSVTDANGNVIGDGNSGVGLQGRYEIQILNSFGKKPEAHECGALYSQKPPLVNACKKGGEWQTYDIIFRAPRFDADGKVTEKPRATVFQNNILIQNNEEFTGMTGIQYEVYKEMTKTGPLVLQGDHDPVQFRNVWVVPL